MITVSDINSRYEKLKSRNVECYLTFHNELFSFFQQKFRLDSFLREAGEHDRYAENLRMLLNYLAFEYANCPLFLNSPYFYRDERMEKIKSNASKVIQSYPGQSEILEGILELIGSLEVCQDNPLLEKIEERIGFKDACLVLINPDCTQAVVEMCENYGVNICINPANSIPENSYTKGIYCGCAKYFPLHSFWAPMYKELYSVRYVWFLDYIKPVQEIYGQAVPMIAPTLQIKEKPPLPVSKEDYTEIELDDPVSNFTTEMFQQYKSNYTDNSYEDAECRIVILRKGKFVFLPADENYTHHCLLNLDKEPAAKKVLIAEFDENTAILLRERGGGDYVAETANKIMGERTDELRNSQSQWKTALRIVINSIGIAEVSYFLSREGCSTASSHQNLRNWVAPGLIRPDSDNDFRILLQYLDLGDQADEIIKRMNLIRRAHRRAGHQISRELRGLIENDKNLNSIFDDGYKIYSAEGDSGGKLGVYMFKSVLDETLTVPYVEVGKLKNIEALYG